jgi:NitT/TauT family transport system permease protein
MIRQPIHRGWHTALGVASFVTLGALYTLLFTQVHASQPNNKTIPTWSQLYHEGFLPAFVPRVETLPKAGDWYPDLRMISAGFKITDESLASLREAKVPEAVLQKLRPLKDREFSNPLDFPKELSKVLDPDERERFQRAVLESANQRYSTQTLWYAPLVWTHGSVTLGRLLWGLVLSVLVAVPLGVLMGCYEAVEAFFLPGLLFLAKIAPTAMIAVFLVLCQTNQQFYVSIIMFGLIPTLTQTVFHAARKDVPEELLFKARTLGAGQLECIWDVVYKYILPKVLEAVRVMIGPAIIYLIAAEWASGETGLGCQMRLLIKSLDMSLIYTYLITLGVFFLLVDRFLLWLYNKICPWYSA